MRWLCRLMLVCLVGAGPVLAQDLSKDILPSAEAQAGWIRLFDGQTGFGWTTRAGAAFRIRNGAMEANGLSTAVTTTEFGDFELKLECQVAPGSQASIFLRCPPGEVPGVQNSFLLGIKRLAGAVDEARWRRVDIKATGGRVEIQVDEHVVGPEQMPTARQMRGCIALQSKGKGPVRFRNVELRPPGLESLFNGTDLSGWYVVPGHASVFSVSPEGWLHVENGNGDIQTQREFGDFTLQIDVFSNGPHLNSGVFFRANAGKLWSGYEAQIRNEWRGRDRTRPVDYGTGAIYNRQAVRKVVSSDKEWFTMTVVATGKHLSTWVNGYQATDFTDRRRQDQTNARKGARTRPGIISLQGHDRTTDLFFRNIRIKELPGGKKSAP